MSHSNGLERSWGGLGGMHGVDSQSTCISRPSRREIGSQSTRLVAVALQANPEIGALSLGMRCRRQAEFVLFRHTRLLWPILGRSGPALACSRLVSKRCDEEESGNGTNCNETHRKTTILAVPGDSWGPLLAAVQGSWAGLGRLLAGLGRSGPVLGRS